MYETQAVAGMFRDRGYNVVEFEDPADVYVINTCSVTNAGARKSRQMIRRARRHNQCAVVVAMGCYCQSTTDEVTSMPEVNIVVGTHGRDRIVDLVERAIETKQRINAVSPIAPVREYEEIAATFAEGRTRAIIKAQDGCNEYCSYCQIPRARGRSRSRSPERVLQEAQMLIGEGFKEIVLTGVHLGTYGSDLEEAVSLATLLRSVADLPGLMRLRISSVDPHEITRELVEVIAENRVICRHLHIPAQAGDDEILRAMRRRNSVSEYRQLVETLRQAMPNLAITTDIIVGFPGETEASFDRTYEFCAEMAFSKIHVFPYSRRARTRAATLPNQVSSDEKRERTQRLLALSEASALAYHQSFVGSEVEVLLEGASELYPDHVQGLTDTYVRVHTPARDGASLGELVTVTALEATAHGLKAD